MSDNDVLKIIALAASPVLLMVIGATVRGYLKALGTKFETLAITVSTLDKDFIGMKKDIQMLSSLISSLSHIREEWFSMKQEVNQVVLEIKTLKSSLEDVVILKRDQATIWRHIDKIKEQLEDVKQ